MTAMPGTRVAVLTVLAAALAGCTAGGGASGAASNTTVGIREQVTPIYRELAQCIRTHGYPDFPDPVINDDGSADIPDDAQRELNQREAALLQACGDIVRRLPASVGNGGGNGGGEQVATPAQVAERRRLAACIRQHGVPDFPDPDENGRFTNVTTPDGQPGMDRQTVRAVEACGAKGRDLKKDFGF